MADHSVNPDGRPTQGPDWPKGGVIRPLLSTRVERKAKALLSRTRQRAIRRDLTAAFDLSPVYQLAASPNPPARAAALDNAFRTAGQPSQAIDATLAALALAIAAGNRPRSEGLVAFLELCYRSADLDAGATRMGTHLGEAAVTPDSVLGGLRYEAGWPALAAGVRQCIQSVEPLKPRAERRIGRDLGPRRVVVRLSGGLGNQLFQYAAALAYARRIGAPLRLDLANYEHGAVDREFLLGRLRIPVRRANSLEVLKARLRPHRETRGAFDDFMFGDDGPSWLCGFWEDPAYFADIIPTVRRRFHPRDESISEAAGELVQRARNQDGPVVGVHLRRGDRGPGGSAFSPFSTLPGSYYRQAAGRFPPNANFLVFSDTPEDIDWCRHHLGLGDGRKVTFGDGKDPILDMFALAECDHVVLSSGTFSWWAGYLGDRPGRRVIAPNPLQGLSASFVMIPPPMPLQPGWEQITLAPGSYS